MKRLLCVLFLLCFLLAPAFAAEAPAVTARAYLVMDAETGQILLAQNGRQRNYPASITKIMTLALAMQKCGGDRTQQVTVSYAAVHALEYGSSHVALQPGEIVTLDDLFHATVLASANDAANVLAEYTAGSMEAFVEQMNRQAEALGMADTHFANASGLHDGAHYTSARDMAVLTRWALTVPGFAELFGATEYTMAPTNKQELERVWGTDNCMLVENKYQYEGTTGGKSGWTNEAGYTMVETVARDGRTLICVVLGCEKKYDKFSDCIALLDICFGHFAPVTVDASAFRAPSVPLFYKEDAPALGDAAVAHAAQSYTFLLHDSLSARDVEARFELPEKAMLNEPFSGTVTLALTQKAAAEGVMYGEIGTFPLVLDGDAVDALLDASEKEFIDQSRTPLGAAATLSVPGTLTGVFLLAAALAGGRMAWVAARRQRRRKRRERLAAEARAPYRAHTQRPARRAPAFPPPAVPEEPVSVSPGPAEEPVKAPPAPPAETLQAPRPSAAYRPAHARDKNAPRPEKARRPARYIPAHARQKGKETRV